MKKLNVLILMTLIFAAGCAGWSNENYGRDVASDSCNNNSYMAHNSYFEDYRRCGGF